jgi:hypothetical protein
VKPAIAVVAALAAVPAGMVALSTPAPNVAGALQIDGQPLAAASCAVRDTLWIHHYAAALYVPAGAPPVDALQDPQRAKALQILILSKTFLPRELPGKWRKTLEEQLDGGTVGKVKEAYRELGEGDLVTLAYLPGPGVKLEVNGDVVAKVPSHALVEALLRDFADGKPVPERVGRTIARHPC